ncbi:MAG TPA: hypothetical protein VEW67_06200 [Thermoleophilaceae bacterium]|nr:hypothetical protein [Thermoleophilaceae bacterium]
MSNLLAIYLNDHLAGATAGVELARRARGSNEGTALGGFLTTLVTEIEEDRDTLQAVMASVGAGRDRLKVTGGWAGEKLGRLKLNGSLLGYSPLSRVVELEGLRLGVEGKACLWRMLRELADPRLSGFDFDALTARAERQRDELERHRLEAGRLALSNG